MGTQIKEKVGTQTKEKVEKEKETEEEEQEQEQENEQLKRAQAQVFKEEQKAREAKERLQAYFNNIRHAIQVKQHYPRIALRKNISGTVVVAINIKSDGSFDYRISDSSGWDILDKAAIKTVTKVREELAGSNQLQALPKTPGSEQPEFKIPLIYSVKSLPR